jgi:transposase-like protein
MDCILNKIVCPDKDKKPDKHSSVPHIVNHGNVVTVKNGERQRLKCQECGRTFYFKEKSEVR